jgi:hypothetical protein
MLMIFGGIANIILTKIKVVLYSGRIDFLIVESDESVGQIVRPSIHLSSPLSSAICMTSFHIICTIYIKPFMNPSKSLKIQIITHQHTS